MSNPTETLPSSALPLHTVADAAKQLKVSLNFLYERIRSNEIPTVNLGTDSQKKLRIRDDSLLAFVQERTTKAAA
ncbi:helix-turn-helix domain-containing protein [Paenarthrobacter ilicis]|uniref:helix-turn-helix domain-containing protein n=1 Tax=Paenarthrobacter ilicis TaxID=43665 RepID=UPI0028D6F8A2|nr:helix-turn-helix domain-containing protein [Paenarthrobacter ilicis]